VLRLVQSIDACGLVIECIAVGEPQRAALGEDKAAAAAPLVLIDGYRRVAALRKLGRDTVRVECWSCTVGAALAQVLARSRSRAFTAIEEALLLRDLMDGQCQSQREAARQCGRDVSWVQRRLQLLGEVPEAVLQAVRREEVSTWSAVRVFVPLARANAADAQALLGAMRSEPLSTRELATWYAHYGQANRTARARMVAQPRLFIQALQAPETPASDDPETQWLAELERLRRQLQRLARSLAPLLDPRPPVATWEALRHAVTKTEQALERLRQPLQEGKRVVRTATPDDPRTARQGDGGAPDRPHSGPRAPHGAAGAGPGAGATPEQQAASQALARTHLDAARALLRSPGECGADAGVAA
jgi:ParB-like chromosome segregation protein Spo0J